MEPSQLRLAKAASGRCANVRYKHNWQQATGNWQLAVPQAVEALANVNFALIHSFAQLWSSRAERYFFFFGMFVVFRFVVTADTLWPTLTAPPALPSTLASASTAYGINNVGTGSTAVLSFAALAARCSELGA